MKTFFLKKKPKPACCSFTFLKFFLVRTTIRFRAVTWCLYRWASSAKAPRTFWIQKGFFPPTCFQLGWTFQKSRSSMCSCHIRGRTTLQQHISVENSGSHFQWKENLLPKKMWSSFPSNKRLNQTKSEVNNVNFLLLLFEGRHRELKCSTTTHKTAAFTLAHVYQYTSYWIHNYIIRYNCICYGLVWQPNEAVIKELAASLMRA